MLFTILFRYPFTILLRLVNSNVNNLLKASSTSFVYDMSSGMISWYHIQNFSIGCNSSLPSLSISSSYSMFLLVSSMLNENFLLHILNSNIFNNDFCIPGRKPLYFMLLIILCMILDILSFSSSLCSFIVSNISSLISIISSNTFTVSFVKLFTLGSCSLNNSQNFLNSLVSSTPSVFSNIDDIVEAIDMTSSSGILFCISSSSTSPSNPSVSLNILVMVVIKSSVLTFIPDGYLMVSINFTTSLVISSLSFDFSLIS